jgi:hypothetical protein
MRALLQQLNKNKWHRHLHFAFCIPSTSIFDVRCSLFDIQERRGIFALLIW